MLYYGNIQLIDGEILNCVVENLPQSPRFVASDAGRIYFSTTTNTLNYNNGTQYIDTRGGFNTPLVDTLGSNWVNSDYSFNPVPFETFTTVTNLSANSTLFTILQDIDSAIGNFQLNTIFDIRNVKLTDTLETGYVCFYNGTDFTFANLNDLINEYSSISTTTLSDITITGRLTSGEIFVWNNANSKFQNTAIFYTYQNYSQNVSFLINHNLGVLYPFVNVVNPGNGQPLIPSSIQYLNTDSLIVNISSPSAVVVNIMGVPQN